MSSSNHTLSQKEMPFPLYFKNLSHKTRIYIYNYIFISIALWMLELLLTVCYDHKINSIIKTEWSQFGVADASTTTTTTIWGQSTPNSNNHMNTSHSGNGKISSFSCFIEQWHNSQMDPSVFRLWCCNEQNVVEAFQMTKKTFSVTWSVIMFVKIGIDSTLETFS